MKFPERDLYVKRNLHSTTKAASHQNIWIVETNLNYVSIGAT